MELEKGSKILIQDLEDLLAEARAGAFGDFTNSEYAAPKMALAERFQKLRQNVIDGKYD